MAWPIRKLPQGYELTVIAACVIGGVSIAGGVGTVSGTLLGALFLGVDRQCAAGDADYALLADGDIGCGHPCCCRCQCAGGTQDVAKLILPEARLLRERRNELGSPV